MPMNKYYYKNYITAKNRRYFFNCIKPSNKRINAKHQALSYNTVG